MTRPPDKIIASDGTLVLAYDAVSASVVALPPAAPGLAPAAVAAAALKALRPRRRGRLLFLTSSLFSQRVRLPRVQTDGLSPAELASSLAFEVEPFSDLSAADGVLAYRALPGDDAEHGAWDVVQMPRGELAAVRKAAKGAGCALSGVAGLPDGWDLADKDGFAERAREALASFSSGGPSFALIVPPRNGASPRGPAAVAAIACVALSALCAADYAALSARIARLAPAAAERERLASANSVLASRVGAIEAERGALAKRREEHEKAAAELAALASAWGGALASMAGGLGEDAVVTSIKSDEKFRAVVEGVGVSCEDVGGRLAALSAPLAALGWKLQPGELAECPGGGTVRFSFLLIHDAADDKAVSRGTAAPFYDDYPGYD